MQTNGLRSRAYNATTLCKDYIELLNGTSSSIGRTCASLQKLRAEVIVRVFLLFFGLYSDLGTFEQTSSEEGSLRLLDNDTPHCSSPSPAAPINSEPERHPNNPLPPIPVPRPRSCPPMLSV